MDASPAIIDLQMNKSCSCKICKRIKMVRLKEEYKMKTAREETAIIDSCQ